MTASPAPGRYTLVSFHAHPDDEALLTAGTLARAAAQGHRVVVVVATAGEGGLAATRLSGRSLGTRRLAELDRSARALGCARVVCLDYADSGMPDAPTGHPDSFAAADIDEASRRLAEILTDESADVLTIYDERGGYGHPDHVQVHRVGLRAAELAATATVLQATVDRQQLTRALRLVSWLPRVPSDFAPDRFAGAYTPAAELTHRVDVRAYTAAKRMAMRAHASQATADAGDRTLAWCLRLPGPLFRRVFGREWFTEVGRAPGPALLDDVFATVRARR